MRRGWRDAQKEEENTGHMRTHSLKPQRRHLLEPHSINDCYGAERINHQSFNHLIRTRRFTGPADCSPAIVSCPALYNTVQYIRVF